MLDTYLCRFFRYRYPHIFVSKTSWRYLEDMSWRRLEDVFSVTVIRLPRRHQDVFKTSLQDLFKTSWKTKNCYTEGVLKTSSRHVFKKSSRRLQYQQMFAEDVWLNKVSLNSQKIRNSFPFFILNFEFSRTLPRKAIPQVKCLV